MSDCLGHLNDFEHLHANLEGLEEKFDVGLKYEVEDPPGNYAGPYLTLHLSIKRVDSPRDLEHVRFHMSREEWGDITEPKDTDRDRLLQRSLPLLIEHLRGLDP